MMSSMRRMAFFAPIFLATVASAAVQPAPASPTRRSASPCPAPLQAARQRQLCHRRLAPPAPERRLFLRHLCPLPRRQPRLAGRKRDAPRRREGDAQRREPARRAAILPLRRADQRQWLGAAGRSPSRHRQARRSASSRRRARGRRPTSPSPTKACCSRASARSSAPPTTTAASTPCCSPRSRPRRSGCCRGPALRAAPPSTRASRC